MCQHVHGFIHSVVLITLSRVSIYSRDTFRAVALAPLRGRVPIEMAAVLTALRVISLATYLYTAYLGWSVLTAPWAAACEPHVAALANHTLRCLVGQYIVESILAGAGIVLMHAWKATDVYQHHVPVACFWSPAAFLCNSNLGAWASAEAWQSLLTNQPPIVAGIASAALTSLNEGVFVLRALGPASWADAPEVRWFQALVTLLVLLENMSISMVCAVLGAWRMLVLGEAWGTAAQRFVCQVLYLFAPLFICFVQIGYTRANWEKVRRGPKYTPRKVE